MITTSLCGNINDCLAYKDGAIGFRLGLNRPYPCYTCMDIAIAMTSVLVGEAIEYSMLLDEWVRVSQLEEELKNTILWRALQPTLQDQQQRKGVSNVE